MTPESILAPVRQYFGRCIPLDPATTKNNPTKALKFFTAEDDGLQQAWTADAFVNPPYGKIIREWCRKIDEEAQRGLSIIALLPCGSGRPGTRYWQDHILTCHLKTICYVRGRVAFLKPDGTPVANNTYPSHLLGFNVDRARFRECFGHLGKVLWVAVA